MLIVDRAGYITRALSGESVSGVTFGGRIYLVREGIENDAAANRTLWHELLHYGLRRFLTKDQYKAELGNLYARDAWIRRKADAWMQGAESAALRRCGEH